MTTNVMRDCPPRPSDDALALMSDIKHACEDLHQQIDALGQSRCYSIAKTKLEEVAMWTVKGIAIEDEKGQAVGRPKAGIHGDGLPADDT